MFTEIIIDRNQNNEPNCDSKVTWELTGCDTLRPDYMNVKNRKINKQMKVAKSIGRTKRTLEQMTKKDVK